MISVFSLEVEQNIKVKKELVPLPYLGILSNEFLGSQRCRDTLASEQLLLEIRSQGLEHSWMSTSH